MMPADRAAHAGIGQITLNIMSPSSPCARCVPCWRLRVSGSKEPFEGPGYVPNNNMQTTMRHKLRQAKKGREPCRMTRAAIEH